MFLNAVNAFREEITKNIHNNKAIKMNDEELEQAINILRDINRYNNVFSGFSIHFHFLQEARKRLEKKVLAHLKKYNVTKGS